jgi:bacterioferritin-associated ferredoxin
MSAAMIVCSCNVLSDTQVRAAVAGATPRSAAQVYGCLGCSPQCGRCAGTIRRIMAEALGPCAESVCCRAGDGA